MNDGEVLRNVKSVLERVLPIERRLHGSTQDGELDQNANASLEQYRVLIAEITQKLTLSKQRSAAAQKRVELLTQTNSYLRGELVRISKKAATANHLAYHDELTGLPNRRLLMDRLSQAIAQASRQKKRVALVFFDVDGFKSINDNLGHAGGDLLLQEVAQRLRVCLRGADTACRYGGDEFVVLLPEMEGEQSATVVVEKIRAQLTKPYVIDGAGITVTLSIGTAVYPEDATDHHNLIRLADAAMYCSKSHCDAASKNIAEENSQKGEEGNEYSKNDDCRVDHSR